MARKSGGLVAIKMDSRGRRDAERLLKDIKGGYTRAIRSSTFKAAKFGRTRIDKEIRGEIAIKRASVLKRVVASRSGTSQNPDARIRISRKKFPTLHSFGGPRDLKKKQFDPKGKGVTVRIRKKGKREKHRRAFIARGRGGAMLILERKRRGGKRVHRNPLIALRGPSVLGVFEGKPGLEEKITSEIGNEYTKLTLSQVDRQLKRRRPRVPSKD